MCHRSFLHHIRRAATLLARNLLLLFFVLNVTVWNAMAGDSDQPPAAAEPIGASRETT